MGGGCESKGQEEDPGYESGEGETDAGQPEQFGGGHRADMPRGWKARTDDTYIPTGWRVNSPEGAASGDTNTPAAGRGDPIKRRIRRGGGGAGEATTSLKILNNNVCGCNSKKTSVPEILEKLNPDICTFQETGLTGTNQIKIKQYHTSLRNRKNLQKMGGVATCVKNYLKPHTVKVMEGEDDDEFLIARLSHINPPLNVVNLSPCKLQSRQLRQLCRSD